MKENRTISDLFSRQVERTPSHPAVSDDQGTLTYAQLESLVNCITGNIIDKTGKAPARVCILSPQRIPAVAGLLGVLKAGKCFVPMLPQDSDDYLRHVWKNSDASLIICSNDDRERAAGICGDVNLVVVAQGAPEPLDVLDSAETSDPEHISAIMYTSGSTGRPKGVMTTEQAILGRAMQHIEMACITSNDRQAAVVPWQFSSSYPDIYAPLLTGACLFMYDSHRLGIDRLALYVKHNAITLLKLPASLVRRFVECSSANLLTTVRYVHCGGGVKVQDAKKLLDLLPENAVLMHGFASTETNLVTKMDWRRNDPIFQIPSTMDMLPAGYPVAGKKIQIVDNEGCPVEPGAEGELVVVSRQIFSGYWGEPQLTSQCLKLLPDSESAYYTGDLGRIHEDGCLEIIGRKGHRAKIHGLRIDFGAVESLLLSLPYVKAAAVTACSPSGRESHLAAYLETIDGDPVTVTRLREDLKKMIPGYMIPSRFIMMEVLPRTANGKIDRHALPAPGRQRPSLANPYVTPRTELEKLLADIWADVLNIDEVGIFDNFLELGGDSLLTVEIEVRLEHEFENTGPISRLLQASTVAQMAEIIEAPERLQKATRDMKLPMRSRIKSLRHRIKRGDVNAPHWLRPFLPSYELFIRLQKFWLSLSPVRFILKEKAAIFKEWIALTGQTDDSGELMRRNLMANTWAIGRNILINQKKSFKYWVSTVGWEHVKSAAEAGRGAIIVFPHTHLFLTNMRDKLILQLFPESYHLVQSYLASGKAAKTIGLAGQFKKARDVLERGGAIWIAGDGRQGKEKIVLIRYGRRFPFRAGAAELSVQTGAPVIPVFPSLRPDGGVAVEFLPPLITAKESPGSDRTDDIVKQYAEIYVDRWPHMLPDLRTGRQRRRLKDLAQQMKNNFDDIKTVFIGGCPRSGTTMLGSILGSAPYCIATPESQFKQTIPADLGVDWTYGIGRQVFLSSLKKNFRFKLWDINVPELDLPEVLKPEDYRRALLSLVDCYAGTEGKKEWNIWIDHTPLNIQKPLLLMMTFPDAKFIHMVRDPRAVAASILPLDWGPHSALHAAHFWAQRISYGQALERAYPDKCVRVYYEDVLTSPEETVRKICDYCGLEFEDSMLKGSDFKIPAYTKKQHELVGSKPDASRLNAWQDVLDIWQIAQIEEVIGDLMQLVGYKKYFSHQLPHRSFVRKVVQKSKTIFPFLNKKRYFRKIFYD